MTAPPVARHQPATWRCPSTAHCLAGAPAPACIASTGGINVAYRRSAAADFTWPKAVSRFAGVGAFAAGAAGVLGGPILSAYPGLDADMLPLALIVVILGGIGSLLGAFIGSFIIGLIYTFGTALFPELAYIILFLPMIVVIAFRPQGLFGRAGA